MGRKPRKNVPKSVDELKATHIGVDGVMEFLGSKECTLFDDASSTVEIGIAEIHRLFVVGKCGAEAANYLKAIQSQKLKLQTFEQLVQEVRAMRKKGGPPQKSQQPSNPVEPEKPKKPSANEQWQALQKQYPGADKVLDFLGKSTLFSTETVVTMGLMRQLLETSPNDTSLIVKYLQKVQEDRTKFSAFPALTNHISTCIQTELMTAELAQKKEKAKKAKKAKKRQRKKERKEREAMEERERQKIASIAHSINGPDNSHNLDDGDDYEDNFGDLESRKLREMQQVHGKGETQAWGGLQNRFNGMGAQGLSGVGRMGLAQTRFANAVVDVSPNNPNSLHFGQPPPPPPALPAYLNDNDHSGFAGGVFERPPARSASEPPHAPNWRDSSNAHNGMGGVTNLDTYKTGLRGLNGSASSSVLPDIPNRLGAQRFPAL